MGLIRRSACIAREAYSQRGTRQLKAGLPPIQKESEMLKTKTLLAGAISLLIANQAAALNDAQQDQTGTDNYADVVQQIGSDNYSTQLQDGDANVSYTLQSGTLLSASSEQRGAGNISTIEQNGMNSQANVSQDGNYNLATVYQETNEEVGHTVTLSQIGSQNLAYVEQIDGAASVSDIYQNGEGNSIDVTQQMTANHLDAEQTGDGNTALVEQFGNTTAYISQTGTANAINFHQDGAFSGAFSSISQNGTGNEVNLSQQASRYSAGDVRLVQIGTGNIADVSESSGFGSFSFTQDGTGNELTAQHGGRSTTVEGTSTGDFNRVDIRQDFDGSSLTIAQNGTRNDIDVDQTGYYGVGDIQQTGTENYASLVQIGNSSSVTQETALIMQNGTGNSAFVTQGQ
ncbi:hypothetical protein E0D86_05275 [Pseudomonas sp. IC_126]|uniref:hypothetical protein n=1 Tax=Pseudomonas sp. IC_126 TaxID=2547400 RepID=UPI0010386C40|nr:hypothetical protein [Pseudomonas sp. IC_126]TCD24598.1 hypothetical protein E0D86_05275 [Pseudomonas sp. IC_126]